MKNCKNCIHYLVCRDWYGHEKGMPNYAEDIDCPHYKEDEDKSKENTDNQVYGIYC